MAKTLDDYKQELKSLESRISSRKRKNKQISDDIERLEKAYNKLGHIKRDKGNNADKVRDNAKLKKVAGDVEWRGEYKNLFDDAMDDHVTPAGKKFFKSIDAMQDEVGKALAKKRGEYDTGISLLNGLNKAWNSVCSTIRNWAN